MDARTLKRWPAWVLLILVVVGFLAVGASRDNGPSTPQERAEALEQRVACPVCQGESVYESRNTASENLRTQIRTLVDEGELSDAEILGTIARVQGTRILLVPKSSGLDALAWALPAAALVCALAGLAVTFRRWRREAADAQDPTDEDRELVAAALASEDAAPAAEQDPVNADQLAELEDERRFLLRSLRDLDAERAAGDVDPGDYETLRDGYTKRAADVLRGIEDGRAALPAKRPRRWARKAAAVGGVLVVAVGVGIVAARSSGERTAGEEMTGGIPGREDTATLLARARGLLGSDPRLAQDAYAQVLDRDPENPEALTYSGWLLYFASTGASTELRDVAVATAQDQLARAVAADATYPDPHCFLAVVAADAEGDVATARAEADQCLALDPPVQVRDLVTEFTAGLGSTPPPTTIPG